MHCPVSVVGIWPGMKKEGGGKQGSEKTDNRLRGDRGGEASKGEILSFQTHSTL